MKSKWFKYKESAIAMRRSGASYGDIGAKFGIPKSTLNNWLKDIQLTKSQQKLLDRKWKRALISARKAAALWHNSEKLKRIEKAEKEAHKLLSGLDLTNHSLVDLSLAMLYLGEGFKTNVLGMGNSNPLILNFFITSLIKVYKVPKERFYCELHIRADQNPKSIKKFWSKELGIPFYNFRNISIDKRTKGIKTYPHYKGVCIVRCPGIEIQRKLLYSSKIFCQKIIDNSRV